MGVTDLLLQCRTEPSTEPHPLLLIPSSFWALRVGYSWDPLAEGEEMLWVCLRILFLTDLELPEEKHRWTPPHFQTHTWKQNTSTKTKVCRGVCHIPSVTPGNPPAEVFVWMSGTVSDGQCVPACSQGGAECPEHPCRGRLALSQAQSRHRVMVGTEHWALQWWPSGLEGHTGSQSYLSAVQALQSDNSQCLKPTDAKQTVAFLANTLFMARFLKALYLQGFAQGRRSIVLAGRWWGGLHRRVSDHGLCVPHLLETQLSHMFLCIPGCTSLTLSLCCVCHCWGTDGTVQTLSSCLSPGQPVQSLTTFWWWKFPWYPTQSSPGTTWGCFLVSWCSCNMLWKEKQICTFRSQDRAWLFLSALLVPLLP